MTQAFQYIGGGGVTILRFLAILGSAAQVRIGTLGCKFDPIYMLYTRQVLAFETLFSTIKLQSNWSYCHSQAGGRQCWPLQRFLSRVALPSLLTPQPWLQAAAARAAQRVVARAPAGARELGCLQVLAPL